MSFIEQCIHGLLRPQLSPPLSHPMFHAVPQGLRSTWDDLETGLTYRPIAPQRTPSPGGCSTSLPRSAVCRHVRVPASEPCAQVESLCMHARVYAHTRVWCMCRRYQHARGHRHPTHLAAQAPGAQPPASAAAHGAPWRPAGAAPPLPRLSTLPPPPPAAQRPLPAGEAQGPAVEGGKRSSGLRPEREAVALEAPRPHRPDFEPVAATEGIAKPSVEASLCFQT